MFKKKSILFKTLSGTIIPIFIIFVIAATWILVQVKKSSYSYIDADIKSSSEATISQLNEFFSSYSQIVSQLTLNSNVEAMMQEGSGNINTANTPQYETINQTITNIFNSDPKNIPLVWLVNLSTKESIRNNGVIKGLPEYDITSRSWYHELMEKKALLFTEPYEDSTNGSMVLSILKPIYSSVDRQMIGAAAIDLSLSQINTMMSSFTLGETGFFILVSAAGNIVYHPQQDLIGKPVNEASLSDNIITAIMNQQAGRYEYTSNDALCFGYLEPVSDTGWYLLASFPEKEMVDSLYMIRTVIFLVFVTALLFVIFIVAFISSKTVKPIKMLAKAANAIAEGDLNVTIEASSQDETGQLAKAFERTVYRLKDYINYINEISDVLNSIAIGNINFELVYEYEGEFAKIKDALLNISTTLTDTLFQIGDTAVLVSQDSSKISEGARTLADGAADQAGSVEELAAMINELSEQVRLNAKNAEETNRATQEAGKAVINGNKQMEAMIKAMEEINQTSSRIGAIISTIEAIANQTNLLSLNASIEAARAGDAGRGFAVVANEVSNLANESDKAVKQTRELIDRSMAAVTNGTNIAQDTAALLLSSVQYMNQAIELIKLISKASEEQAYSINEVSLGVGQISTVVDANASTSRDSAASSSALAIQAARLHELLSRFNLKK